MSAFIKLNKQDAFITPYTAHKTWSITNSQTGSYGIQVYTAISSSGAVFTKDATLTTDNQYAELVYKNLKHLYYSGVSGSHVPVSYYESYDQSTLYENTVRYLPATASVFSIPKDIFGHAIKPGTVSIESSGSYQQYLSSSFVSGGFIYAPISNGFDIYDNGEGILLDRNNNNVKVGDIIYTHGQLIITDQETISDFNIVQHYTIGFKSSYDVFTHTYNCRSNQSQLNFSQNPTTYNNTLTSGSINSNLTGSEFQPYVTTVGLYNDAHELIAIGKLGQPIPKSQYIDTTFVVKFDI